MQQKTKMNYEEGKHDLVMTREFDLPLDLLFKAYEDPQIVEQWMGTKVLRLENRKHGCYQFETTDPAGNKHGFNGTIHEFIPNKKIVRTFEMENTPFEIWLEFLEFEAVTPDKSKLNMHMVFKTTALRDKMLQIPFAAGLNMAHNRLQEVLSKKINN